MGFLKGLFGGKQSATPPPIPHNSVTMMAPEAAVSQLALDAYKNVAEYLKQRYACDSFNIQKVEPVAADPDLLIDGHGRIHKGVCSERWHIRANGRAVVLEMAFGSDGKGGSLVAIGK
jgi:hypothetical protein